MERPPNLKIPDKTRLHPALYAVRHTAARLHGLLGLRTGIDLAAFNQVLDTKLLPQLDPGYPLVVAITGGGSSGKSSLFNALVGRPTAAVKAQAGVSRRVLAAIDPEVLSRAGFMSSLFATFGAAPEPLEDATALTTPGVPQYVASPTVPPNVVLLDTPDFDTGDREHYINRDLAKPVLEASDVLIYLFTNANYNSRANTEFLRHVLTDVGYRGALLVYRCSRVFSEAEVREHAATVARNLYGDEADRWCLGVFRADEDDRVTGGQQLMTPRPVGGDRDIRDVLSGLDPAATRAELIRSAIQEVRHNAGATLDAADAERRAVGLYRDAVRIAADQAAQQALKSFPVRDLMLRFTQTWEKSQPRPVRIIKKFSKGIAWPVKKAAGLAKHAWTRATWEPAPPAPAAIDPVNLFEIDLAAAANELRCKSRSSRLAVSVGVDTAAGPAIATAVEALRKHEPGSEGTPRPEWVPCPHKMANLVVHRPASLDGEGETVPPERWEPCLEQLIDDAKARIVFGDEFDAELVGIAADFRKTMSFRQKTREFATAGLTLLPPVVAVIYVIATGDVASTVAAAETSAAAAAGGGATGLGVAAKISSLFGIKDLWVVTAIPVSAGLNRVDRENLHNMLKTTIEKWYALRKEQIRSLLESAVTANGLARANALLRDSEHPFIKLREAMAVLAEEP